MCSVRHKPIPSAPYSRALAASSPVSAFARTASLPLRISSAHLRIVSNSFVGLAAVLVGIGSYLDPETKTLINAEQSIHLTEVFIGVFIESVLCLIAYNKVIRTTRNIFFHIKYFYMI